MTHTAGSPSRAPDPASLAIRPIDSVEDFHGCEDLQRRAWGFATDLDVVPLTQLVATRKAGGVVLGAFEGERLRGFTYGFIGRDADGTWLLYSHMTAVDPELKSGGLGRRLKWAQRDEALARGLSLMVWTYDPLESLNGYFNFSKLGVVARNYWRNLYGETSSDLHRGTPTDRLRADWYLESERVLRRERGEAGRLATEVAAAADRYPIALSATAEGGPGEPALGLDGDLVLCQIPRDVQALKRRQPGLASAWRTATAELFTHYLTSGWFVRECVRTSEPEPRTFYVLERGEAGPLED